MISGKDVNIAPNTVNGNVRAGTRSRDAGTCRCTKVYKREDRAHTSETKLLFGRSGGAVRGIPAGSLLAGENLPSLGCRRHVNSTTKRSAKLLIEMKHWRAWNRCRGERSFRSERQGCARFNRRRANTAARVCRRSLQRLLRSIASWRMLNKSRLGTYVGGGMGFLVVHSSSAKDTY